MCTAYSSLPFQALKMPSPANANPKLETPTIVPLKMPTRTYKQKQNQKTDNAIQNIQTWFCFQKKCQPEDTNQKSPKNANKTLPLKMTVQQRDDGRSFSCQRRQLEDLGLGDDARQVRLLSHLGLLEFVGKSGGHPIELVFPLWTHGLFLGWTHQIAALGKLLLGEPTQLVFPVVVLQQVGPMSGCFFKGGTHRIGWFRFGFL